MYIFCYLVICLIFGTTFLGIKVGVEAGGPPLLFAAIRFGSAGVLMLLFLALKKVPFPRAWRVYGQMMRVGVLTTTLFFGVLYWAEQFIPSNLAALLNATSPILICLIGAVQRRERLHGTQVVGLLLGIVGVYLIVGNQAPVEYRSYLYAVLVLLGAQVFNAYATLATRKLFEQGISAWMVNGFQMMFGSLGLFVISFLRGESLASVRDPWGAFGSLVFLIVLGSIIGWGLYYLLMAKTNPLLPSTWSYISPVVAMVVGAIWMKEQITWLSVVGGIIVLIAVGISNWLDWKKLLPATRRRESAPRTPRARL